MIGSTTLNQNSINNQANSLEYIINSSLLNVNTILPCKILTIDANRASVQPIVNMLDALGSPQTNPVIYDVPFIEIVGGNAGVIIQYKVGDVVAVGFCQRDISAIKPTWTTQNPAGYRKFDLSDGIIIGKLANTRPSIFVKITESGIELTAPDLPITLNCDSLTANCNTAEVNADAATVNAETEINGNTTINGNLVVNGTINASGTITSSTGLTAGSNTLSASGGSTINGSSYSAHQHSGVQPGGGNTGGVV